MEKIKNHYTTIYDQLFSNSGNLLATANNFGEIAIFNLSPFLNLEDESLFQVEPAYYHPAFSFKSGNNCLFSLAKTKEFLIGGGVGIIQAWRWEKLKGKEDKQAWDITLAHGNNLLRPEINSLVVDTKDGEPSAIYGGCGDNNIYCWDIETRILKSTFKGHSDYIHDISLSSSGNELYSASDDGSVKIWDTRTPSNAEHTIHPYKTEKLHRPNKGKWIGCLDLDPSEEWLVCGGGPLLSSWHLRTMSCCIVFPTPQSTVNNVVFQEDSIFSAGSEPFLNHWDFSGALKAKIPTSAIGVFSIALNSDKNKPVMSIGGRSSLIDICTNMLYKDFSLNCSSLS